MHIYFTVAHEANVRQYVIEAAMDSVHFEMISTLASNGNTVLPRVYEFIPNGPYYTYYRIKQMGIDGTVKEALIICPLTSRTAEATR